jgi:hypothetical protein
MSPAADHPIFTPPSDPNIKIWRYMDFTKYVSMLDTGGLYFSRSDLLGDPFEASSSQANIALRLQDYEETIEQLGVSSGAGAAENYVASYSKILEWHRQWLYVNSWHMNEYESAAMWGLYAKTDEAIAVQSRFARLRECLPSEVNLEDDNPAGVYIGEIKYIDYERDRLPEGNLLYPVIYKRKSFEHERELRAVIWDTTPSGDMSMNNPRRGQLVKVPLAEMIEAVYVAPIAPSWFRNLVAAVTVKYGFANTPIVSSSLAERPVY